MMSYGEEQRSVGLLGRGASLVLRNFRYVIWFFLLNLLLGWFGVMAFAGQAHSTMDRSLYSDRLVHGFDLSVFSEFLARPETGPLSPSQESSATLIFVFFLATAVFLPGVFQGYASKYRLPRDEFFRACGRNLWRFVRLLVVAGVVIGIVSGLLFAAYGGLVGRAGESTNELLPFETKLATLAVIFLVMTALRIAFDLAEIDAVLSDQSAVRKSIAAGFRHMWQSLARLLGTYVVITVIAALICCAGLWVWVRLVPAESLIRAFLLSQLTLLLLLIPRFWQRAAAVAYWEQRMMVPVVPMEPVAPQPSPTMAEAMPAVSMTPPPAPQS